MPVSPRSRYAGCATISIGERTSLAFRRPPVPDPAAAITHTLIGTETFEELAWVYYGRSQLWWLIADANPRTPRGELSPLAWRAGDVVLIPRPAAAGPVPRS